MSRSATREAQAIRGTRRAAAARGCEVRVRRCDECGDPLPRGRAVRLDGWPERFCSDACAEAYHWRAMDEAAARD